MNAFDGKKLPRTNSGLLRKIWQEADIDYCICNNGEVNFTEIGMGLHTDDQKRHFYYDIRIDNKEE